MWKRVEVGILSAGKHLSSGHAAVGVEVEERSERFAAQKTDQQDGAQTCAAAVERAASAHLEAGAARG